MTVRKLFAHQGIAYRAIDMDSVEYKAGDRGLKIRKALGARTNMMTVPQVFVGGELIGGSTEVVKGLKDGCLVKKLAAVGITPAPKDGRDPATFLPKWLQPR